MIEVKRVKNKSDTYKSQYEEYETQCYCSICGEYLGSKDFTYKTFHKDEINPNAKYCMFCGEPLYKEIIRC